MLESQFRSKCVKAFLRADIHADPIETGETKRGVPDIHIFHRLTVWIECKVCRNKEKIVADVTPDQIAWHEAYNQHGGNSLIAVLHEGSGSVYVCDGSCARQVKQGGVPFTVFPSAEAFAQCVFDFFT